MALTSINANETPRKTRKKRWLIIPILVVAGVLLSFSSTGGTYSAPKKVAMPFATDIEMAKFSDAYQLMSPRFRQEVPLDSFVSTFSHVNFGNKAPHIYGYSIKSNNGTLTTTIAANFPTNAISMFMQKNSNQTSWYVDNFVILNTSKY